METGVKKEDSEFSTLSRPYPILTVLALEDPHRDRYTSDLIELSQTEDPHASR